MTAAAADFVEVDAFGVESAAAVRVETADAGGADVAVGAVLMQPGLDVSAVVAETAEVAVVVVVAVADAVEVAAAALARAGRHGLHYAGSADG